MVYIKEMSDRKHKSSRFFRHFHSRIENKQKQKALFYQIFQAGFKVTLLDDLISLQFFHPFHHSLTELSI